MENSENVVFVDSVETGNKIISDYTGTQGNYRFDATLWKVLFDTLNSIPEVISIHLQYGGTEEGSFRIRYKDKSLIALYENQNMCESWNYDQPFKTAEHAIWYIALRMIVHTTTGKALSLKIE